MTPEQAVTYALREIDLRLQKHGRSNSQVGLPPVTHVTTEYQLLISDFACAPQQQQYADNYEQHLSDEQRAIYDAAVSAVRDEIQAICMIDAPAGTGKIFTERVVAARLRSENKFVAIVVSTGIAALQLPGGWTAHSTFKSPLEDANVSGCVVCNIAAESQRAEVLPKSDLIIWDELPKTHRFSVEALDNTSRDITQNNRRSFGGKSILFS